MTQSALPLRIVKARLRALVRREGSYRKAAAALKRLGHGVSHVYLYDVLVTVGPRSRPPGPRLQRAAVRLGA